MYDDSAGAMYEQEEYARKEALRKKKILIRRIIVVSTISILSLYTILFLIDQGMTLLSSSIFLTGFWSCIWVA